MGIVIEKEKGPCTCFKLDGEEICHKKGVIGFLSNRQERELCSTKEIKPTPIGIKRRHEEFTEIAGICSQKVRKKHPKGERLLPYLHCMREEAEKRGLEI